MKLKDSFELGAPVAVAWETVIDVERLITCLPRIVVTAEEGKGGYEARFQTPDGAYAGRLWVEALDRARAPVISKLDSTSTCTWAAASG